MPVDERTSREDRCSHHPTTESVATCDGCGRTLCLACAVPVRGLVLGSECLAQVLGDEPPTGEPTGSGRFMAAGIAFAAATLATLAPWTTLGHGSGPLGAWSASARWSMLAALAAAAGLFVEVATWRLRIPPRSRAIVQVALGVVVLVASVLAFFRPPFPADSLVTPWAAAAAGAVAVAVRAAELRRRGRRS